MKTSKWSGSGVGLQEAHRSALRQHIQGSAATALELSRHSEVTVVISQDEVGLKLDDN